MKIIHNKVIAYFLYNDKKSKFHNYVLELFSFGYKQALSTIFPVFIFLMLAVSKTINPDILPRYDFLLIVCILAQLILFITGIESKREVLVIFMFHAIGVILELHKVNVGSWSYPEFAYSKFYGVPLYSGFMYSSVASYIIQSWSNLNLKITNWPMKRFAMPIGFLIYLNFFTNAFFYDYRWILVLFIIVTFWKTNVAFNTNDTRRKMPLIVSFVLIGFFIWLAENISTLMGAWKYASQHDGWQMVSFHKITSWSLLVIVSIIIVFQMKLVFSKKY